MANVHGCTYTCKYVGVAENVPITSVPFKI